MSFLKAQISIYIFSPELAAVDLSENTTCDISDGRFQRSTACDASGFDCGTDENASNGLVLIMYN